MKVSIIVPAYNVQRYISRCLESCLKQDLPPEAYEILVVDDGSPDRSAEIAYNFASHHANIRVISRENGGLSAARNTGLKAARGEYVWFVDSDDWIEESCLGMLYAEAKRMDLDVLCFNRDRVYEDGRVVSGTFSQGSESGVLSGDLFMSQAHVSPGAWCAWFRRTFLQSNSLCFYEGILHEDQEFMPRVFFLAERVSFVDRHVYKYLQRVGSIMRSEQGLKRAKDLLKVADSLYAFYCAHDVDQSCCRDAFRNKIAFMFMQSLSYYHRAYFGLDVYRTKPYYPLAINDRLCLKERLKMRLCNGSLNLFLFVYWFLVRRG